MSNEVKDFIMRCCAKKPQDRLGIGGSNEIFEHPWFKDVDIAAINSKSNTEYKRTFGSKDDISAFDPQFTDQTAILTSVSEENLARIEDHKKTFENF